MSATLIPASSEDEWLEARRQGITASEIAIVMGLSPYSSPYALYHQKRGQLPGQDETDAMQLGRHMESFVAARFAERHPEFCVHGDGRELWAHPERSWQMATPDRVVQDGACHCGAEGDVVCACLPDLLAVLECKIDGGSDEWGDDGSDEIPVHYRCQVLWQMDVMGVTTGYVACLLWNKRKVRAYELTLDDAAKEDLLMMRGEARLFLRRIEQGDPPDVDWRPATTAALKHLHASVEDRAVRVSRMPVIQYRSALKAYKAAEQRKKLAENRLRLLLGNGNRVIDAIKGDVVASRQVYDLAAKTIERKASTVDKLVPARAKKEQA